MADQPGGLPLLEFALTELFHERAGDELTAAGYQRTGGVLGALGRRAEDLYAGYDEPGRAAIRQVFLRLVTVEEGAEDTRRRIPLTELHELGDRSRDVGPGARRLRLAPAPHVRPGPGDQGADGRGCATRHC